MKQIGKEPDPKVAVAIALGEAKLSRNKGLMK